MPVPFFLFGLLAATGAVAVAVAYERLCRNMICCELCGTSLNPANEAGCAACGAEICTACLLAQTATSSTASRPEAVQLHHPLCPGCSMRVAALLPRDIVDASHEASEALTETTVGAPSPTEGTRVWAVDDANRFIVPAQAEVSHQQSFDGSTR